MLDEVIYEYRVKLNITTVDSNWKFGLSMNNIITNYKNITIADTLDIDSFMCTTAGIYFSNSNNIDLSSSNFTNNWVFYKKLSSSSILTSQSLYIEDTSSNVVNWNLRNLTFNNHTGYWKNNVTKNFSGLFFTSSSVANDFKMGAQNSVIHLNLISDTFNGTLTMQSLNLFNNSFYGNGMLISTKY